MKIYDVTVPVRPGMPVWPGDPAVERTLLSSIAEGAGANVSLLKLGVHAGTHLDAPFHFIPGGDTVESLPVDVMVGPARLIEIDGDGHITAEALEAAAIPAGTERLLVRTANTRRGLMRAPEFHTDFAAISADGAEWLVRRDVKLVGVDYLSVEPFHAPGAPTHRTLLGAGVIALEGLDLTDVPAGDYTLLCAPVKLQGSDGAPARVMLIEVPSSEFRVPSRLIAPSA